MGTLTLADAIEAQKLYTELQRFDAIAGCMASNLRRCQEYRDDHPHGGEPLCLSPLEVKFAYHTSTYSGPCEFRPNKFAMAIGRLVLKDIMHKRDVVAADLLRLGFEPPQAPKLCAA